MKHSIFIVLAFVAGIIGARTGIIPPGSLGEDPARYSLYLLMFLVGAGIGADSSSLKLVSKKNLRLLLIPLITIAGTFAGVLAVSAFLNNIDAFEALAVGAGFGYYSLSSIIISQMHSESLGVIALLSNIIREIITLLTAPLMVMVFGKLAPVSAAGATSMDTTLPVITRVSGREFAIIALFHGILLTILVPLLITLILQFRI